MTNLTPRELATVLAALRALQSLPIEARLLSPEHFAEHEPLSESEIDALCERLNV
jgi:hypothetical protein